MQEDPNRCHCRGCSFPVTSLNTLVFINQEKKWAVRCRGGNQIISRMYSVSHRNPEKFYLLLVLLHVPGMSSSDHLRTVDGTVVGRFREACIRRRLSSDEGEP